MCPALVSPEEHGLCKNKPSANATRALVLLAKLLQSVANETSVSFGSDETMGPLHSWVKTAIPKVQTFFLLVLVCCRQLIGKLLTEACEQAERDIGKGCNFANELELPLDAIPNATASADNKCLTAFVQRNGQRYREKLRALGASSSLAALAPILG